MTLPIERCVLQCFSPEAYAAVIGKPVGQFSLVEALRVEHHTLSLSQVVNATDDYPSMTVVDITPVTTGELTESATCVVLPPSYASIAPGSAGGEDVDNRVGESLRRLDSDVIVVQLDNTLRGGDCVTDLRTANEALLMPGDVGLLTFVGDVASTAFTVTVSDDLAGGSVGLSTATTSHGVFRLLVGGEVFRNLRRVVCQMPSPLSLATEGGEQGSTAPMHFADTTLVVPIECFALAEDDTGNLISAAGWRNSALCLTSLQLAPAADDFFLTNVFGDGYFDLFSTLIALAADQLDGKAVSEGDVVFVELTHADVANLSARTSRCLVDGVDVLEVLYSQLHHGVEKWDGAWLGRSAEPTTCLRVPLRVVSLSGESPLSCGFGFVNVSGGITAVSLTAPVSLLRTLDSTPLYAPAVPQSGRRQGVAFPKFETLANLLQALQPVLRPLTKPSGAHVLVVHGIKENWPHELVECALRCFGLRAFCVSVDALDTDDLATVLERFLTGACSHHVGLVIKNAQNLLPEKRHLLSRLDSACATSQKEDAVHGVPRVVVLVCESLEAVPPSIAARATNVEGVLECGNPSEEDRSHLLDWLVEKAVSRFAVHRSLLLSTSSLAAWTVGLPVEEIVAYAQECISAALALAERAAAGTAGDVRAVLSDTLCEDTLQQFLKSHGHNLVSTKLQPVRWSDVGGLEDAKRELRETIQLPMLHPELFASGMKKRTGILFYGPPGCGKTLLAKAVATEMNMNFMSVKGPELINQYVGESEKNIRLLFQKARDNSPCIVFFDELDALVPARGAKGDAGGAMDRIVSQLLVEVDGVGQKRSDGTASGDVFIIGATNRPDLLDPSLLRPGRFDRLCYLGMPSTKAEQLYAVKALTRKFDLHEDVDLEALIAPLELVYTGADFFALCSDAMMLAVEDSLEEVRAQMDAALRAKASGDVEDDAEQGESDSADDGDTAQKPIQVSMSHFLRARDQLKPSVSAEDLLRYEALRTKFSAT